LAVSALSFLVCWPLPSWRPTSRQQGVLDTVFVDELYFLAAAEHLAWGYVDMPPLLPAVTAVLRATLGDSLLAVRVAPAVAGAALVLLTGRLAGAMGGGLFAQFLAALGVLIAPIYLSLHSFHSMNAFEPLVWTGCAYLLVRITDGADPKLWLAFGLLAGVGLLNKSTTALFGFAVLVGLILSVQRKQLAGRWVWLGALVALIVVAPYLVWMVQHDFPHLQMLANIREEGRNVALAPVEFVVQQIIMLHPLALPHKKGEDVHRKKGSTPRGKWKMTSS